MTSQAHRSPAPALEADARAVELLKTFRMVSDISNAATKLSAVLRDMQCNWQSLNKPDSEIAELETIANWNEAVYMRLLAMADECDKEFAALDDSVRDEAEQALGS